MNELNVFLDLFGFRDKGFVVFDDFVWNLFGVWYWMCLECYGFKGIGVGMLDFVNEGIYRNFRVGCWFGREFELSLVVECVIVNVFLGVEVFVFYVFVGCFCMLFK